MKRTNVSGDGQRWQERWTDSPRQEGRGYSVVGAGGPLLVLLFLFSFFVIGFRTGKTHVTFVNTIFTKILLA
jgi:hypothetical protein